MLKSSEALGLNPVSRRTFFSHYREVRIPFSRDCAILAFRRGFCDAKAFSDARLDCGTVWDVYFGS
jgi:hypothetical protein